MIRVVPVKGKGRGVLAVLDICASTTIEIAPVKPFKNDFELCEELRGLPLEWKKDEGLDALAFGMVQFVNHSDDPNCEIDCNYADLTITLYAARDIKAGEELTIDYGIPLWFDPVAALKGGQPL
jgi:SET domain